MASSTAAATPSMTVLTSPMDAAILDEAAANFLGQVFELRVFGILPAGFFQHIIVGGNFVTDEFENFSGINDEFVKCPLLLVECPPECCLGESIKSRPEEVARRDSFGHWEIDTVVGKRSNDAVLLTLTERMTSHELILPLSYKTSQSVNTCISALKSRFGQISHRFFAASQQTMALIFPN